MYVCIYIYMYVYIYIYIYIFMCGDCLCLCLVRKIDNMHSRLLSIRQWRHGNSCTSAHDVRT